MPPDGFRNVAVLDAGTTSFLLGRNDAAAGDEGLYCLEAGAIDEVEPEQVLAEPGWVGDWVVGQFSN